MTQPLLSVLIPAYNQPAGIERILARLQALGEPGEIELRVSDDSSDDGAAARIEAAVQALPADHFATRHYQRNRPAHGAVPNWNALLAQATGRYLWLLHHDEEPDAAPVLAPLLAELRRDAAEVWILRCRVQHRPDQVPRLHFPPRWAAALLRRWPAYLLRRNLVGPPSALIVRDCTAVRFDEGLVWLVDVEAYVRLLSGNVRIAAWPGGGVLSRVDAVHSITAGLQPDLAATARRELDRLAAGPHAAQAAPWAGTRWRTRGLRAAETLLWAAWRIGQRLRPGGA